MIFSENDKGLFYLSCSKKLRRKNDRKTGKSQKRYILKDDLINMLKKLTNTNPVGNLKGLQKQCASLGLLITQTEEVIEQGWMGQPNGSFQILFEQGWIDPSNWKQTLDREGYNRQHGEFIRRYITLCIVAKTTRFSM
jgi:hypothetical protein